MDESNFKHIFIDESGDPSLAVEKEGVSNLYILSAIIVDPVDLSSVTTQVHNVIKKFFQTGEMKSSSVGKNIGRRKKILESLGEIEFKYFCQVIDKTEIFTDSGLYFKRSFVKYIHRTLYQRLFKSFTALDIIADEHGTSKFMKEFQVYLEKHLPFNLFERSTFRFGDSKSYPLLQLSDMIAGTIGHIYDGKAPVDLLNPIRENTIIIDEWPPRTPQLITEEPNEFDDLIRHKSIQLASQFLDKHTESNDIKVQAQVASVRYFLYHFRSVDPEEYIPTKQLHGHLSELGFNMSGRVLRSDVIGNLRENNVFIVSSSKGLKIPYNLKELKIFTKQVNDRVMPYLRRLKILRDYFLLSSSNSLDIIDEKEFPNLYKIIGT